MPKTKAKAKTKAATTTKRTTAKKSTPKASKSILSQVKVERRAEERPFFEFRVTQQTLYWLIFGAVSIAFALWIFTLDAKVQKLYDEIDADSYSIDDQALKKAAEKKAEEKKAAETEPEASTEPAATE